MRHLCLVKNQSERVRRVCVSAEPAGTNQRLTATTKTHGMTRFQQEATSRAATYKRAGTEWPSRSSSRRRTGRPSCPHLPHGRAGLESRRHDSARPRPQCWLFSPCGLAATRIQRRPWSCPKEASRPRGSPLSCGARDNETRVGPVTCPTNRSGRERVVGTGRSAPQHQPPHTRCVRFPRRVRRPNSQSNPTGRLDRLRHRLIRSLAAGPRTSATRRNRSTLRRVIA